MRSNQKEDFLNIIEQHQAIINHLCGIYYKNKEDQKDTRQDIVLQLWKAFPHFRADSKVSTWIYSISLRTILSKIRQQKRRIEVELVEQLPLTLAEVTVGVDDDLQQLSLLIDVLQEQDKAIVILYLEGYKNKEIATILQMTTTNVSTKLHRIKSNLKAHYKKMNHELG